MSELTEFYKTPLTGFDTHPANAQLKALEHATTSMLVLPFDIAREMYAKAVQAGVLRSSMLASRDFSRALGALEATTLGPWARRV